MTLGALDHLAFRASAPISSHQRRSLTPYLPERRIQCIGRLPLHIRRSHALWPLPSGASGRTIVRIAFPEKFRALQFGRMR
jgi:hypothetical protein